MIWGCAAIGPAGGGPEDNNGPSLINIEPPIGTLNLPLNQKIIMSFSESLDPNSVQAAIQFNSENKTNILTRKNSIIISPIEPWDNEKILRINLSRNIRDFQGNSMENPIDIIYSTSSELYNGKIYGKLVNYDKDNIYEVGLFKYSRKDSLKLLLKTQLNNLGEFQFEYLKKNKYVIISSEGKIENIYDEIKLSKYGINSIDYIDLKSSDDSLFTEIYIDEPLPRLEIKTGKLIGNNHGIIYYSNGEEEKFYFDLETQTNFPNNLKINKVSKDSLVIKSNLKNRLTSYYTDNYYINYSSIQDSISPVLMENNIDKNKFILSFDEPTKLSSFETSNAYYLDLDSSKIILDIKQENPFTLSIYNLNKNISTIFLDTNLFCDFSGNYFPDSTLNFPFIFEEISLYNPKATFGQLSGEILNFNADVMVEAINLENGNSTFVKSLNEKFHFYELNPGKYKLRAFEILNSKLNTTYFSGTLAPYKRAAKFTIYPENIDIRARWEIEGIKIRF